MSYLLDISALVALLVADHPEHARVMAWMPGKTLKLCPFTELGFLRVIQSAYNATPEQARQALQSFVTARKLEFIPADISALAGLPAPSYRTSTDWYLANLASHHGLKWATLDTRANHPARELIR